MVCRGKSGLRQEPKAGPSSAVKMLVGKAGRAVSSKRSALTRLVSVWVLHSIFQLWSLDPLSLHMERNNLVQTYFYFSV